MPPPDPSDRVAILNAIRTPLSFLVLGFLVIDATVAGMAAVMPRFATPLVWTLILSIPGFVITVVALAVWRPEALRGDRPLQDLHSKQFASDLVLALDGPLRNLEPLERTEAWVTLIDIITSDGQSDPTYQRFCSGVATHVRQRVRLDSGVAAPGPVPVP